MKAGHCAARALPEPCRRARSHDRNQPHRAAPSRAGHQLTCRHAAHSPHARAHAPKSVVAVALRRVAAHASGHTPRRACRCTRPPERRAPPPPRVGRAAAAGRRQAARSATGTPYHPRRAPTHDRARRCCRRRKRVRRCHRRLTRAPRHPRHHNAVTINATSAAAPLEPHVATDPASWRAERRAARRHN